MKKGKKLVSMFLAAIMVVTCFGTFASPQEAYAKEGLTDWSADAETYEISCVEDLAGFRNALNGGNSFAGKKILLTKDIALTATDDVGTLEVAADTNAFSGTFNGNGHSITGWTKGEESLFNIIDTDGVVKNFTLEANENPATAGFLICYNNRGNISRVAIEGSMTSPNGINAFCRLNYGTIQKCISYVDVTSTGKKKTTSGFVYNSSKGTISECIYTGTVTCTGKTPKPYGFSCSELDSDSVIYKKQESDLSEEEEWGFPVSEELLKNKDYYNALGIFDMENDWAIDESHDGFPHLIFPAEEGNVKEVPVKLMVSVEDCIHDNSLGEGRQYFPLKARFVYTGNDETIKNSFDDIAKTLELKATLKESAWKKDFVVKTPINGVSADFSKKKASDYYSVSSKSSKDYEFDVKGIEFEDTEGTYRDDPAISNVLTKEEKDAKVADMESAAKKILDLCHDKYGDKITRDPFLTFTAARLDYYPAGLTKDDFFKGLLGVYQEYKDYVASKGEIQEVTEVSKYILALTAMGYDAKQFGDYNLIDELENADINGKYFAQHYRTFAIYSGRYGDYNQYLEPLIGNVLGKSKEGSHDAEDMPVMHMQPIGLEKDRTDIKDYIENTVIPWMENCVTGMGSFNSIYTNGQRNVWTDAQAHMLLALCDADFLGEGFVHNGNTIVDGIIAHPELSLGFFDDPSQCARGLMALIRAYKGQTNLFDCTDITGVLQVQEMINNIPVAESAGDTEEIARVYAIYNSLTDIQKSQITNVDALIAAMNTHGINPQVLDADFGEPGTTASENEQTAVQASPETGDFNGILALVGIMCLAAFVIVIESKKDPLINMK